MRILAGEIQKVFLENIRVNLDLKALKLQKVIRRNSMLSVQLEKRHLGKLRNVLSTFFGILVY